MDENELLDVLLPEHSGWGHMAVFFLFFLTDFCLA